MWIEPCEQVSPGLSVKLLWIYLQPPFLQSYLFMQMSSQNKLPTTYFPVAFLKICLNSWSVAEAVVKSFLCCVKSMFWWNLVTKEGTGLFFNLTRLVLSLDFFTELCFTMGMGSAFVTGNLFQPQDWPPITITKSLKTLKRFEIGFLTFSKP